LSTASSEVSPHLAGQVGRYAHARRRSAIKPMIGHMKNDGLLRRNWLRGSLGDALHAAICGAGHNLRMILRKLRLLHARILALLETLSAFQVTTKNSPAPARFVA